MINLGKIKYEKCQPPFLRIPAPEPYFFHFSNTTPFFNFSESPPVGEVIKIYFLPPLKMGEKWGRVQTMQFPPEELIIVHMYSFFIIL